MRGRFGYVGIRIMGCTSITRFYKNFDHNQVLVAAIEKWKLMEKWQIARRTAMNSTWAESTRWAEVSRILAGRLECGIEKFEFSDSADLLNIG